MGHISDTIHNLHNTLPESVQLVAVSKFHPVESLREAYDAGQRIFGESRVQELIGKVPQMPTDVQWHFIGHLQSNKVKPLIGVAALIESVDSLALLQRIDRLSAQAGVTTRVLLQVHVAREETKFGFSPDELVQLFENGLHKQLKATKICGIMGMASNTDNMERVRSDFREIARTRQRILQADPSLTDFNTVSMGMSGDYPIAIDEGATLVRIGTSIFGNRNY